MMSNYMYFFLLFSLAAMLSEIIANFPTIGSSKYFYRLKNKNKISTTKASFSSNQSQSKFRNDLKLEINLVGEDVIQKKYNNISKEAGELLDSCFPNYTDPEYINIYLKHYDAGFFFRGETLVGFISSKNNARRQSSLDVFLYSVCVREDERENGIAKNMISEYMKTILTDKLNEYKNIYVGLSVLFTSESAVSAFKLYAKIGFNRWWERCSGIHTFNFAKLDKQFELANPNSNDKVKEDNANDNKFDNDKDKDSTNINDNDNNDDYKYYGNEDEKIYIHPMSKFILNRWQALKDNPYRDELCMIMKWNDDDFDVIGRDIQSHVLKEQKYRETELKTT